MFCHRYYLKHLTDPRYERWPLADHVQLLQARCRGPHALPRPPCNSPRRGRPLF